MPTSPCRMLLILPLAAGVACAPTGEDDGVRRAPGAGDTDGSGTDGGGTDGGGTDGGGTDGDTAGDTDGDTAGDTDGVTDDTLPANEELRGVWLTRFEWAGSSASATGLEQTLADIADAGFNAVFFQIRGNFDAYYDSALEPWASSLTGTLGQDPGWDPLATAVAAAHAEGLEVHAYMNVAPFWRGTSPPDSVGVAHGYSTDPEWVVADRSGTPMALNDSYVYATLGNPDVRARTAAVAADLAARYDIDGVHLDYIRYPGSDYSHDAVSEARYTDDTRSGGALEGLSWEDWQREMVKDTVRQVSAAVDVPVTAAVWGVHTDEWGWGGVSEGNGDYYQDSRAFLSEGLLDANIPMAYWPVADGQRLDFRALTRDHVSHASGRHVYMGIGTYEIGFEETVRCIEAARDEGADGVVVFSWTYIDDHAAELRAGVFAEPATVPRMPWR